MDAEASAVRYESKHGGTIGAPICVALLLAAVEAGRFGLPQTLRRRLSYAQSTGR